MTQRLVEAFALFASTGTLDNYNEWLVYCSEDKQKVVTDADHFKVQGKDDQGNPCDDAYYTKTRILKDTA